MTKKVYLDANVLIAHQTKGHKYFQKAKQLIEDLWRQKSFLYLSSLTIDEFWYGISFLIRATKKKNLPFAKFSNQLEELLEDILSWQKIKLVSFKNSPSQLKQVLSKIKKYNLRPRDAFHLQITKQQKIPYLATFDNDFERVQEKGKITILN